MHILIRWNIVDDVNLFSGSKLLNSIVLIIVVPLGVRNNWSLCKACMDTIDWVNIWRARSSSISGRTTVDLSVRPIEKKKIDNSYGLYGYLELLHHIETKSNHEQHCCMNMVKSGVYITIEQNMYPMWINSLVSITLWNSKCQSTVIR